MNALAEEHHLPPENLLSPDALRSLAWQPPAPLTAESVEAALAEAAARPWQRELVVPVLTPLLSE